jgi:hypothetical protein
VNYSLRNVKADVEEILETERRKCYLIIHGMLETDAEQDMGFMNEMMDEFCIWILRGMWIRWRE